MLRRFPARRRPTLALSGVVLVCFVAACAAPVGVTRLTPRQENDLLDRNALTTGQPSDATQIVLRRYALTETFADAPETAIARLRGEIVAGNGGSDEFFALAELSYIHAMDSKSRSDALAAALYAYAFVFPYDAKERAQELDPRYRWACDIYSESLVQAFRDSDGVSVRFESGTYQLPYGTLAMDFDLSDLIWGNRVFTKFIPVQEFEVYGMRNHYRSPGIGVPLAAVTASASESDDADEASDIIAHHLRVPATAVLRLEHPRQQIVGSELSGRMNVFSSDDREVVDINDRQIPLEIDRTTPIAMSLVESAFWKRELEAFFGDLLGIRQTARLVAIEPYRPGRIPVVFVHGTASSPARWADMINDLLNDPNMREHFQFWFFAYDSGNPIAYSSMLLRRALTDIVSQYDPEGRDDCLRQMVVIGHSQGGLLTKMTVIDSGSAFWDSVTKLPFDKVRISDKSRALLQEALFVKPLPFVSRVVFIATPHHGSYLAGPQIVRRLMAKLISMPREVASMSTDLVGVSDPSKRIVSEERLPTSIDNMSPGNPFIKTLSTIPIAPNVHAHSIIPVEGYGPLEDEEDGVVAYKSAHIEGVESEKIIRPSTHSTQSNPETVAEVHRILMLQATTTQCSVAPQANATEPSL